MYSMQRSTTGEAENACRYLTEAVYFPTALLPSRTLRWEHLDDNSARATLVSRFTDLSGDRDEISLLVSGCLQSSKVEPSLLQAGSGGVVPKLWQLVWHG